MIDYDDDQGSWMPYLQPVPERGGAVSLSNRRGAEAGQEKQYGTAVGANNYSPLRI